MLIVQGVTPSSLLLLHPVGGEHERPFMLGSAMLGAICASYDMTSAHMRIITPSGQEQHVMWLG